ncbi:hypothetical protein [Streptomyces sp. NPDC101150]|uniref:hypothetical protein n=1 Tax=Streptomyces sp. NPDC101150 TaxID=3366114 RepID=UPI0037F3D281
MYGSCARPSVLGRGSWRRLREPLPGLAAPVLDAHDPALRCGFRYRRPGYQEGHRDGRSTGRALAPHRAGFLGGAAGVALALHTYATGRAPEARWDAALLLG